MTNSVRSVARLPLAALLLWSSSAVAQTPAPADAATRYLVFFRGQPVGREDTRLVRTADGWLVRGESQLGQPLDITTRSAEVNYDASWRPRSLAVDAIVRGQDVGLKTTFDGGQAINAVSVQGNTQNKTDAVSADPVVLPNTLLGAYTVLARRLQGAAAGAELRAYVPPQGELALRVTAVTQERIDTPKGSINVTRYALVLATPPPGGDLAINVWADASGSLLRMNIPAQTIEMAREDISSAAARTVAFSLPGDESVTIPSIGFNIAATINKPASATAPLSAVILIGGSGPTDRDETVAGIPVFGQIARDLVAAGYFVVRYDKRGVGQSGGRAETVTIADYAEDARQVLLWVEKRKDVNKDRIALVGHSEGALVAMLTAGRERNKVSGLVLVAGPSTSGNDIVLEQQKLLLSRLPIDDAQRKEKVALQEKINAAVIKGTGWNDVPEAARRAADNAWFYSFLTFDPAKAMADTRQPVLIVQGELDTQVQPYHADKLAEFARARKGAKTQVEVVKVPGINHLLVPAKTGDVSEYGTLGPDSKVSTQVTGAIAAFLTKALQE